jgi:hypothetical protein
MPLESRRCDIETGGELYWFHLVGLGEHDLIADRGGFLEDYHPAEWYKNDWPSWHNFAYDRML